MNARLNETNELVIDASIGVKWFVPEENATKARLLLRPGLERHVPTLFFTEVAQTFWKKVHQRRDLTLEEGREAIESLLIVPLTVHSLNPLLNEAFEIATTYGRSVYDSVYLALAESLGCPFVTADLRLYNALKGGPRGTLLFKLDDFPG